MSPHSTGSLTQATRHASITKAGDRHAASTIDNKYWRAVGVCMADFTRLHRESEERKGSVLRRRCVSFESNTPPLRNPECQLLLLLFDRRALPLYPANQSQAPTARARETSPRKLRSALRLASTATAASQRRSTKSSRATHRARLRGRR